MFKYAYAQNDFLVHMYVYVNITINIYLIYIYNIIASLGEFSFFPFALYIFLEYFNWIEKGRQKRTL